MSDLPRQPVGPWTLSDPPLGHGGNAIVWRATHPDAETAVALKVLNVTKAGHIIQAICPRDRVLREHQTIPGLLPLLDGHLPEQPTKADRAWLAMPIATPIAQALASRPLAAVVVEAVAAIADTLARLHADYDIAHRDIKPGNLYELDGSWLIGDFGLVSCPTPSH